MLWNQLPNEAKLAESISSFKSLLRLQLGIDKLCISLVVMLICNRNCSSSSIRNFSISLEIYVRFLYVLTRRP